MGLQINLNLVLMSFSDHSPKGFNSGQLDISLGRIIQWQEDRNHPCLPDKAMDRSKIYLDVSRMDFGLLLCRKLRYKIYGFCDGIIPGIKYRSTPGYQRDMVSTLGF